MANERLSWQKKRRVVSRAFVGEREVLWRELDAVDLCQDNFWVAQEIEAVTHSTMSRWTFSLRIDWTCFCLVRLIKLYYD